MTHPYVKEILLFILDGLISELFDFISFRQELWLLHEYIFEISLPTCLGNTKSIFNKDYVVKYLNFFMTFIDFLAHF